MKLSPVQFMPKLKTTMLAGTIAASTLFTTSFAQKKSLKEDSSDIIVENVSLNNSKLDLSKPNLPLCTKGKIVYKNIDGDEIVLNRDINKLLTSLYTAVQKCSTAKCPDIKDAERFYIEVQKNIPKLVFAGSDLHNLNEQCRTHFATNLFDKMYDMFTAADSDKGKTISVKEYTLMMDAWQSMQSE